MGKQIWVSFKMDEDVIQQLMEVADRYGSTMGTKLNRSDIMRLACSEFLQNRKIVDIQELPGPKGHVAVPVVITTGRPSGQ